MGIFINGVAQGSGDPVVPTLLDYNIKLEYVDPTTVRLVAVDSTQPAYIPILHVGDSDVRLATLPLTGLEIDTTAAGIGGLEATPATDDMGYNVYVLADDNDPDTLGAFAAPDDGTAPVFPAGWGSTWRSAHLRHFCCNTFDGAANYNRVTAFRESDQGEIYYTADATASLVIMNNDSTTGSEAVPLYTSSATRKGQLPSWTRKVMLNVEASNYNASVGGLSLYFNSTQSWTYYGAMGTGAGNNTIKTFPVVVPCNGAVDMDNTALLKEWSGTPGAPNVSVYAAGYKV